MEKQAGLKREWIEQSDESGSVCEETESRTKKRLCKDINVDVGCEITNNMEKLEELDWDVEEIDEEMVWDIIKILDGDQIPPSPSRTADTGKSSINGSDELESTGEYKDCMSFNAELDHLLGASDDELGIPCTHRVNSDYEYDSSGSFFESQLEVERAERQLVLQMMLGYGESVEEGIGSDPFSIHHLHMVFNQSES